MPRTGPTFPVTAEWKAGVKQALFNLGWSYTKLGDEVGVTRSAISRLLGPRSTLSSLVPAVEIALGWKVKEREVDMIHENTMRVAEEFSPEARKHVTEIVQSLFGSADQMELIAYYRELNQEDRARVLERARLLWEQSKAQRR